MPSNSKRSSRGRPGARQGYRRGMSHSVPLSKCYSLTAQETPGYGVRTMRESKTHVIVKTYRVASVLTTSTSVPTFASFYMAFDGIPDYTSFQAVFDEFKIVEAEVWLTPNLTTAATESIGQSVSVVDFSDSKTPTAISGLMESSTAIIGPSNHGHYHKFTPQVDIAAFQAGATFGYATRVAPWLLTNNPSVQHYGIKFGVDATTTAMVWDANVRLRICLRRSI